jgi:hypothetical protein
MLNLSHTDAASYTTSETPVCDLIDQGVIDMRGVNDGHNYSKAKPNAPKTQWAKPLRVSEWIRPLEAINAGEYMPHIDFVHVVVFVGMPGSGKSTASRLLLELAAQAPAAAGQWTRISQDELGGRKACEVNTVT